MNPTVQRAPGRDAALAACLATVLEVDLDAVPADWASWLAARNLQLAPIAEPLRAGFWLAERDDRIAVMFGAPPELVWDPAPDDPAPPPTPDDRGYVLAALAPARFEPPRTAAPAGAGIVEALFVAPAAEAPTVRMTEVEALPGRGLAGDRYAAGTGHFSVPGRAGQDLTLIAAEALEALRVETGIELTPADARRNVLTRGIDLNALVGQRFAVGDVQCVGQRWCEPCAHLQRLTQPGVLRGLIHRGGLRAEVLTPGRIRAGDAIRVVGEAAAPAS